MEKQKLPNATLILVLGILTIISCCCYSIPGFIVGIITLVLAHNATKVYQLAPENYSDYGNVRAGKIMAIIGLTFSFLFLLFLIWCFSYFGWEALQNPEMLQDRLRELQEAQG